MTIELDPVSRLTRDLKTASKVLSADEARFLVDAYYNMQRNRIRSGNQERALGASGEPHAVISWLTTQFDALELGVKSALDAYSAAHPVGEWMRAQSGIGPVIAAGLLAHINIRKAPTAGHIYSFAGLDPKQSWIGTEGAKKLLDEIDPTKKMPTEELLTKAALHAHRKPENVRNLILSARDDGEDEPEEGEEVEEKKITRAEIAAVLARRPWNAGLKTLCWKIGESFTKVSGSETAIYGRLYREHKERENMRNQAGDLATQAAESLAKRRFGADTQARKHYEAGHLPPARIHLRAQRWAVKIFLSHMHTVWFWTEFGRLPPLPYAMAHLGHAHMIPVPQADIVPGLAEALYLRVVVP